MIQVTFWRPCEHESPGPVPCWGGAPRRGTVDCSRLCRVREDLENLDEVKKEAAESNKAADFYPDGTGLVWGYFNAASLTAINAVKDDTVIVLSTDQSPPHPDSGSAFLRGQSCRERLANVPSLTRLLKRSSAFWDTGSVAATVSGYQNQDRGAAGQGDL